MTRLAETFGGSSGGSTAQPARESVPAPHPVYTPAPVVDRAPEPVYQAPVEPAWTPEPVPAPAPAWTPAAPEPVAVGGPPAPVELPDSAEPSAPGYSPASGPEHYERHVKASLAFDGARGAGVFDVATGELLAGAANDASLDLAVAARTSADLVRAKLSTMKSLGLNESMEDIVATFSSSFHILGTLTPDNSVFAFLAVNNKSQLSLVRLRFTKLRDHTA